MQIIKLKSGKELSLQRRHPWVFSGALTFVHKSISDGDTVEIQDNKGNFLAIGHYQGGTSIALRIISFDKVEIDQSFWDLIISKAISYRRTIHIIDSDITNTYRLFHGEGDGVPGLIIDIYNDVAVIQCHSVGVHRSIEFIKNSLIRQLGQQVKSVYVKTRDTLPEPYAIDTQDALIHGTSVITQVLENNIPFHINVETGQKTGFFLDQRDNRDLVGKHSKDRTVLNCFCYTGGFSMYALAAGASEVISVDISQKAMDLVDQNVALGKYMAQHKSVTANVMHYLSDAALGTYDVVIVDPPAFAKSVHKRHNAVQAYKRLNALAIKKVKPGGLLFTFSCSQVVGTQLFYDTIVAAGIEAGRNIRVMHHLSQGADHPIHLFHPEGHYLKGLMLYVE
jgi:23S rRNA (cytosine1962-C5)-methyltransferase